MSEDEFAGHRYRFGRLSAMDQFHVSRRLAPIITEASGIDFTALARLLPAPAPTMPEGDVPVERPAAPGGGILGNLHLVQPLTDALSKLTDEQCEYVIGKCLAVVTRLDGTVWAQVWSRSAGRLQYVDITMPTMMSLVVRVIIENLTGFFTGPDPS